MNLVGLLPLIFMLFVLAVVVIAYMAYARSDNDVENDDFTADNWAYQPVDSAGTPKPQHKSVVYTELDDDWKDLASAESQFSDHGSEVKNEKTAADDLDKTLFAADFNNSNSEKNAAEAHDETIGDMQSVISEEYLESNSDEHQAARADELDSEEKNDNEHTIIMRNAAQSTVKSQDNFAYDRPDQPEQPIAFGYRMCWLAIPDVHPQKIVKALDLHNTIERDWTHGLNAAYEDKGQVFVTPYINGYTLVIGRSLWHKLDLDLDIADNTWIKNLSKMLGEVMYFSTTSDLNNHAWAILNNGKIARAYGYSGELGEVVWNYGKPTKEEQDLHFCFVGYPNCRDGVVPNQDNVVELARDWSLDTTFAYGYYQPDLGCVGDLK